MPDISVESQCVMNTNKHWQREHQSVKHFICYVIIYFTSTVTKEDSY